MIARIAIAALLLAAPAATVVAQDDGRAPETAPPPAPGPDSVVAVPNASYSAGWPYTLLFGQHWRGLWTTPIKVPVLDPARYAGGLTPLERGGGKQTKSLRLQGGNGRVYQFRSLDKDPSAVLPPEFRGTIADDILQDQISSSHPAGALMTGPILDAAGVLHAPVQIAVLKDDPRLGEYRKEFGGLLGTIEERPTDDDEGPGFAGATNVENTHEIFERLEKDPDERVDLRAYLAARLVDLYVGDWDRHFDQWKWIRTGGDETPWIPVPRDRDQAFVRLDGLLLTVARTASPQLVSFGDEYPPIIGLTWNGRVLDRRFLPGLEWPVWDSIATDLQRRMTDSVIDAAVARMPDEFRARNGATIARALRARRETLPQAARDFYELLAREVDVHATDERDVARAVRGPDDLTLVLTDSAGRERFRRRFIRDETREIRLYLHGGDDEVTTAGEREKWPLLRVVGGGGDDRVVNTTGGGVRVYDHRGENVVENAKYDRRAYDDFTPTDSTPWPPRDWGVNYRLIPWFTAGPDVGLFVGAGVVRQRLGFRKSPWATRYVLRGGYATGARAFRVELLGDVRRVNTPLHSIFTLRASGVEVLRFHGFGNETPLAGSDEFYRVAQTQYIVAPALATTVGAAGVTLGAIAKFASTNAKDNRFISIAQPYGSDDFGQVGLNTTFRLDRRDHPVHPLTGVLLNAGGSFYPALWNVDEAFGEAHGEVAGYLTPGLPLHPTFAARVGAKRVWGRYPYHEAAFVGGANTVRGLREQRFAGDAAVWTGVEARLPVTEFNVIVPGTLGIFGLADAGRVWLEGEESSRWHSGVGGGIWLSLLDKRSTVSIAVVGGEDRTAVYFRAGFGY